MSQLGDYGPVNLVSLSGPSLQALAGNGQFDFSAGSIGRPSPGTPHSIAASAASPSSNMMGLCGASMAGSSQVATAAGFFRCVSCDCDCPLRLLKFRGNQKVCQPDVNNYAALVGRWKQNKKLKDWWSMLPVSAKIEWYRREQNHCAGTKRDFSQVSYTESASQMSVGSRYARLLHIPLTQFIRVKFAEGMNRPMAIAQFNEIVTERRASCVWENNEWHVPDYLGIESAVGSATSSGWSMSRSADDVRDTAVLRSLVQGGAQMVAQSRGSDMRALQAHMPAALPDAPVIQRNPAESTAFAEPSYIIYDQITMEAHLRIMSSRSEIHETMVM
jgi:hypothetical protein